jgi:hypothetical protein
VDLGFVGKRTDRLQLDLGVLKKIFGACGAAYFLSPKPVAQMHFV